jgi:hypothetical protein
LTIDEELSPARTTSTSQAEYVIYFGGGSKMPPVDIEWNARNLRKFADGNLMNSQRSRFSTLQQNMTSTIRCGNKNYKSREEG